MKGRERSGGRQRSQRRETTFTPRPKGTLECMHPVSSSDLEVHGNTGRTMAINGNHLHEVVEFEGLLVGI